VLHQWQSRNRLELKPDKRETNILTKWTRKLIQEWQMSASWKGITDYKSEMKCMIFKYNLTKYE
jgi:hypothetical protein